jgi:hypothetical protein
MPGQHPLARPHRMTKIRSISLRHGSCSSIDHTSSPAPHTSTCVDTIPTRYFVRGKNNSQRRELPHPSATRPCPGRSRASGSHGRPWRVVQSCAAGRDRSLDILWRRPSRYSELNRMHDAAFRPNKQRKSHGQAVAAALPGCRRGLHEPGPAVTRLSSGPTKTPLRTEEMSSETSCHCRAAPDLHEAVERCV